MQRSGGSLNSLMAERGSGGLGGTAVGFGNSADVVGGAAPGGEAKGQAQGQQGGLPQTFSWPDMAKININGDAAAAAAAAAGAGAGPGATAARAPGGGGGRGGGQVQRALSWV